MINKKEHWDYTYKFLKNNQNYLWFKSRILLAKESKGKNKTLITGSSHALCGFDTYCFENAINCSMHSQDLYLDAQCAKKT